MIKEKVAKCDKCNHEQIIKFQFDDGGNYICSTPFVCEKCLNCSCVIKFDTDPTKWHGVIGSNG